MAGLWILPQAGAFVALPNTPLVEVQLTPGVWTDITPDIIANQTVNAKRGIPGHGPLDHLASTGLMAFTLRNDATGGRLQGRWSPNHANVTTGWTFGAPARFSYRVNNTIIPLWTGKIRTIRPSPGVKRAPHVDVTAQDCIGDLAEAQVRRFPTQFYQTETSLMLTVINALPVAARPALNRAWDAGLDTYPVAGDDMGDQVSALALINDAVTSAQGLGFPAADGSFVYRNRHTMSSAASKLTLLDTQLYGGDGASFDAPSSLDTAYNHVRVTVHPRTFGVDPNTVLYRLPSVMWVTYPAGNILNVTGTYTDPVTQETVGGTDFQDTYTFTVIVNGLPVTALGFGPTPYVDYEANTAVDGTGTDVTSSISVSWVLSASTVTFIVVNNGAATPIYLVGSGLHTAPLGAPWLRVRGRPIYDRGPATMEAQAAAGYGDQTLDVDLPYQGDVNFAQGLATYLQTRYQNIRNRIDTITLNPQALGLATCLALEIGDVITVSETMTGLSSVTARIQAIEYQLQPWSSAGYFLMTLQLAPQLVNQVWIVGDPVAAIVGSTTIVGWG